MVRKLDRTVSIAKKIQESKAIDLIWKYPGHTKELLTVFIPDIDETKMERLRKRHEKILKRNNYIIITDEDQIEKLFRAKARAKMPAFYDGRVIFAIWKYSQLLTAIEEPKERDEFFAMIDTACENEILNEVIESRICKRANFFDYREKIELSKGAQLVERKDGDNTIVWKAEPGKKPHAARRNLDLYDLSLATIKKAIKVRKLTLVKPKK